MPFYTFIRLYLCSLVYCIVMSCLVAYRMVFVLHFFFNFVFILVQKIMIMTRSEGELLVAANDLEEVNRERYAMKYGKFI
jgi:hypothetical protein